MKITYVIVFVDIIDLAHVSFASFPGELKSMDPQRLAAHRAALSARRTSAHGSESYQTEEASRLCALGI